VGKRYKKGTHYSPKVDKKFKYRSGWELKYMKYLDGNPDIISYDYESFKIPYIYRKKSRNYTPDFIIDGKLVIEIKPKYKLQVKKNIAKLAALEVFCKQNNLQFKVLTEIELKELGIL
jgi:hypothetical protein